MSDTYLDGKYRLMAPGPVQVSENVLKAFASPVVHHRTPGFAQILQSCLEMLPPLFGTKQPVLLVPTTGTGAMEAAIVNCFSPGDEVLCVTSGKFGSRWKKICETFGIKVHPLNVEWGEAVDLEMFEKTVSSLPNIKGVLSQACETSTGTNHPIKKMGKYLKENHQALFIVDGITSVGCTPISMDKWGIDVLVSGSQKAFAMPPGLSFIALSKRAWEAQVKSQCPKYYLDLKEELKANEKQQTRFSSVVSHIFALKAALDDIHHHGLDHLARRTQCLAESLRKFMDDIGLKLYSKCPSPSVTAIQVPNGIDGVKWRAHIEEKYNITIMGGQDQLKGKIIRIGHMGDISNHDQLATLEALGKSLMDLGFAIEKEKFDQAMKNAKDFFELGSNV